MWTNAYSTDDVGRHIATLRKASGRTQAEFAEELGVARTTISSLERGGAVSAQLMVRALTRLGDRLVLVSKDAAVTVREP